MTILAGVDAGGSHTEAAIRDAAGSDTFRFRAPPSNLSSSDVTKPARIIVDAVKEALSASPFDSIDTLVVGAAGAGDPNVRKQLIEILTRENAARTVHVVSDVELQLEAAFPAGTGIVLSAGTGSIAMARDRKRHLYRVGGHGFRFGDEGSGYAIGRAAVQAVLAATEGRGAPTLLVALLYLETGVTDAAAFAFWTRTATREAVADLAPVGMLAAQAGDPIARTILTDAATGLASHVRALAHHLTPNNSPPIALCGGLLMNATPLRAYTLRKLRKSFPSLQVFAGSIDAVEGALRLAQRMPDIRQDVSDLKRTRRTRSAEPR